MGTICAFLLGDLFLYGYEAEFIQRLLIADKKHLVQKFNFTDDDLSLNNLQISVFIDLIYPRELEIKDTTESSSSAPYFIESSHTMVE